MQEIRLDRPVCLACPERAPGEWLHPSSWGETQPEFCPPSAPRWSISQANLPKSTQVSDIWVSALGAYPYP